MPYYRIKDHYTVERTDILFSCPVCFREHLQSARSDAKEFVTFCEICEEKIIFDIVVCPSCNSSRYVTKLQNPNKDLEWMFSCSKCIIKFVHNLK